MDWQTSKTTVWLGQRDESLIMNLGDFGDIRANVTADLFETKYGNTVYLTSCRIEMLGTEIEMLHRITPNAKETLEYYFLSMASSIEEH